MTKQHSKKIQTKSKEYSNNVQTYSSNTQTVFKQHSNNSQTIIKQASNTVQTLFKHDLNTIQTTEIDRILREPGCSYKYFRNLDDMTYPRLRLAIEQSHKEFVGHIYRFDTCQLSEQKITL